MKTTCHPKANFKPGEHSDRLAPCKQKGEMVCFITNCLNSVTQNQVIQLLATYTKLENVED